MIIPNNNIEKQIINLEHKEEDYTEEEFDERMEELQYEKWETERE